ncbi:hypothetical protein E2562_027519 [Oryza meyeriana var. granulata]|uniref:Phytocyanin domain-containing protein n=1 Tax=Oryza meyeriana var. granulata TaxID=110450 RepID=A0A6G1E4V6_9ORYZ|nr:hypothetical protein E2562_027519 [Oryza meyeriana var. granulata]
MMAEMKAAIRIAAAVSLIHVVSAADYTIGNAAGGWGGEYKAWVASQTFAPGDTLTFKYNSYHNLEEVTKDDYEACSATNPVSADSSGTTTIMLTAPGKRYFICGAPGHCQSGMKLEVDVADRPAPATPSPPPLLPPSPRHAKLRPSAPIPLPPAPAPWSPAPAPAATQRRHSGHKKHRSRHLPPKPAPAMAPTVQSVEADFPVAAFAPMSSPPPPPPMSSDSAAVMRQKWSDVIVGLVALGLVVLAL